MVEFFSRKNILGDALGSLSAMLVALPAAVAFGLVVFSPLGPAYSSYGALFGMLGTIALGLTTPIVGKTTGLVTAPCAPAAAVLAAFVLNLINTVGVDSTMVPIYMGVVIFTAGLFQIIISLSGGGKFIKYIPYPVVAGYLSAVGILILGGQFPKVLGVSKSQIFTALVDISLWSFPSLGVALITMLGMVFLPKVIKNVPGAILGFIVGLCGYWMLSITFPELRILDGNKMLVGRINLEGGASLFALAKTGFPKLGLISFSHMSLLLSTSLTLAVLLSIDTLKTCVLLDVLTKSRHNSTREIFGQGFGNLVSSLLFAMPGAGTSGPTLVNINGGAKTPRAGFLVGVLSLLAFFLFLPLIGWIPVSVLAGILMVIGYRMVDFKSVKLAFQKSTIFDFCVILAVVVTAVSMNLIIAAGVGVGLSILLFVRDQIHGTIVRRKSLGNAMFSKKQRTSDEFQILLEKGDKTAIIELQGALFFGTTDQFYTEIRPILPTVNDVILDFDRVKSVDFTACNILKQMISQVKESGGQCYFSSVAVERTGRQNILKYFKEVGLLSLLGENNLFLALDEALEFTEEKILDAHIVQTNNLILDLKDIKILRGLDEKNLVLLRKIVKEVEYKDGEMIFHGGDQSDEMYFIRNGNIRIQLDLPGGGVHTLSTFKRGNFFGDMSFLDRQARSANAVAVGNVSLYVLSRKDFDTSDFYHSSAAGQVFLELSKAISYRLRQSNIELRSLKQN